MYIIWLSYLYLSSRSCLTIVITCVLRIFAYNTSTYGFLYIWLRCYFCVFNRRRLLPFHFLVLMSNIARFVMYWYTPSWMRFYALSRECFIELLLLGVWFGWLICLLCVCYIYDRFVSWSNPLRLFRFVYCNRFFVGIVCASTNTRTHRANALCCVIASWTLRRLLRNR